MGDRTKARYLRVYDKGVESGTAAAGELWRAELEAKKGLVAVMWRDLQAAADVRQWSYDSVSEQWSRSGYGWPLKSSSRHGRGLAVPSAAPSDAEKLKRWLRTSVAPAIERLGRTTSRDEIEQLLLLDRLDGPRD